MADMRWNDNRNCRIFLCTRTKVLSAVVLVAQDGGVLITLISMHYLFDHTRRQLQAWAYHTNSTWPSSNRTPSAMRQRLAQLLKGIWNPKLFTKAADKKPRGKPKPIILLKGGHSSVQRILDGKANMVGV